MVMAGNKRILNERVSGVLYHFTTLNNALLIAKKNALLATPSGMNASDHSLGLNTTDAEGRMKYPFYFCFSRTRSSAVGYPAMRRNSLSNPTTSGNKDWVNMVRLEIDGDYINANYRGKAVNYFKPNDKTLQPNGANWNKVNIDPIQHRLTQGTKDFVSVPYADRGIGMGYFTIYHTKNGSIDLNNPLTDKKGRPVSVKSKTEFRQYLQKHGLSPNDYEIAPDGNNTIFNKALNEVLSERQFASTPVEIKRDDTTRQQLLRMMSEYEDRIYSKTLYIENADRFIRRVDVLMPNVKSVRTLTPEDKNRIQYLVHRFGNIVHLFNNSKDFDTQNDKDDLLRASSMKTDMDFNSYEQQLGVPLKFSEAVYKTICIMMSWFVYSFPINKARELLAEYATKILKYNTSGVIKTTTSQMVKDCIKQIKTWDKVSDPRRALSPIPQTINNGFKSLRGKKMFEIHACLVEMRSFCENTIQTMQKVNKSLDSINKNMCLARQGQKYMSLQMVTEIRNRFYNILSQI